MKITCIGHSGFLVNLPSYNIIFDYYTDSLGIITPSIFADKKTCVFVSHKHSDHYNKNVFEWDNYGDIMYVLDAECPTPDKGNIFKLKEGGSLNLYDGAINVRAYGSTDEGLSFLVSVDGLEIFHAGDLNDWYWEDESTPEELQESEESYLRIIRQLAGKSIDIAFIPEDPRLGIHANRGIRHFREIVQPKRIIPMHFPGNDGVEYL